MSNIFIDIINVENGEICLRYWQVDENGKFLYSLKKLEEFTGLKYKEIKKIVNNSCKAYYAESKCSNCDQLEPLQDRREYSKFNYIDFICIDCFNKEQEILINKKIEIINNEINDKKLNKIKELSFQNKIFLLAFIRYCCNEELSYLNRYSIHRIEKLSPRMEFDGEIIEKLYNAGVLVVNPDTSLDYIDICDEKIIFDKFFVDWKVICEESENISYITDILEESLSDVSYLRENYNELIEICNKNNQHECYYYLDRELTKYNFNSFKIGDKTKKTICDTLKLYSVGQVFYLINKSIETSALYYLKKGSYIHKNQAANSVVGNIQKFKEKYFINKWNVYSFRPREYQQSILCQVLYNFILHIDDGGIHHLMEKIVNDNQRGIFP